MTVGISLHEYIYAQDFPLLVLFCEAHHLQFLAAYFPILQSILQISVFLLPGRDFLAT